MKRCAACSSLNPPDANFCTQCGRPLPADTETAERQLKTGGFSVFALSIVGSIVLSLILVFVFGLPIFFLAGFLPLVWLNRKK
jgi:uncharacterized membrane protein YvbJ